MRNAGRGRRDADIELSREMYRILPIGLEGVVSVPVTQEASSCCRCVLVILTRIQSAVVVADAHRVIVFGQN